MWIAVTNQMTKLRGEISDIHREDLKDELESGADLTTLIDLARVILTNAKDNPEEVFDRLGIQ